MAAGLQTLKLQIKAVANIKKLTSSMKTVSTSRLIRAQKRLKIARTLGHGSYEIFNMSDIQLDPEQIKVLVVAATSDRGLCGSLHLKVCRIVRNILYRNFKDSEIVCLGEKSKAILRMEFEDKICLVVNGVGLRNPTFLDAARIAQRIVKKDDFMFGQLVFCKFQSLIAFKLSTLNLYSAHLLMNAPEMVSYESEHDELPSYVEFSIAALLFYALCESYATELAFRVNVMSNAVKNAGSILTSLQTSFNKTRQGAVTKELIDVVSGALYV